jgi:formyl-CoA transferase
VIQLMSDNNTSQPDDVLQGTMVVSLEQAVAAPYCGLLLANAGARVIKVERPEGDFARGYDTGARGQSAIFAWLNRGKQSVCLDLKTPQAMLTLRKMLTTADVLLSNLAPGALQRLGLHAHDLRRTNPGLITCSISGYGETGDAATKKAYDFLVQAESALCSVTGTEDNPARVGISIADISTGLTAYSAILQSIINRTKTGSGVDLQISMFDVLADWMNMPLLAHRYMGGAPGRMGLKHSFVAPYGAFTCGDGGVVLLSVQSNREFESFCGQVLLQPELSNDARFADNSNRYINRVALDSIINDVFSCCPLAKILKRLDNASIASARLNSVAELSDHPFLNQTSARIGTADVSMAALPLQNHTQSLQHVPALDEHGDDIRREFAGDV